MVLKSLDIRCFQAFRRNKWPPLQPTLSSTIWNMAAAWMNTCRIKSVHRSIEFLRSVHSILLFPVVHSPNGYPKMCFCSMIRLVVRAFLSVCKTRSFQYFPPLDPSCFLKELTINPAWRTLVYHLFISADYSTSFVFLKSAFLHHHHSIGRDDNDPWLFSSA